MRWLKKNWKKAAAVALLAAAAAALPRLSGITADDIAGLAPESLPLAALVLIAIYAAKVGLMVIPMAALNLAAGMLLPTGWALAVATAGIAVEFWLGYAVGKRLGMAKVRERAQKNERAGRAVAMIAGKPEKLCFLLRLLPIPGPYDIFSMLLGAAGVPFGQYMFFSLLGALPKAISLVLAGAAIYKPLSAEFLVPFAASLIISCITYAIYGRIEKRRDMRPR